MAESKGHLNPGDPGVSLGRFSLGADFAELVRHVWVARWHLPPSEVRTQLVLTYPGCNAVISAGGADLFGPVPRVDRRELEGCGQVLGILLQPAATHVMSPVPPVQLAGKNVPLAGAPWREVSALLADGEDRTAALAALLQDWLADRLPLVDDGGRLVNRVCRLVESDSGILTVGNLARRAGIPRRSLHRLLSTRVGVSASWLIERRRLQEAATRLREEPELPLAALAADLGYADQAHLTRRFQAMIGLTPGQLRKQSAGEDGPAA